MTAAALPITDWVGPGVYEKMTAVEYHADQLMPGGSLSSTGARKLLPPSCPALFKWEQDNPRPSTKALDTGNAAHDLLLGGGPEIVEFDIPDWKAKKNQDAAAAVRARGAIPMRTEEMDKVRAMVASIRAHPVAGKLFEPGSGIPEASLFWTDERTGVNRRARLDFLPHPVPGRRLIIPDLKTTECAQKDKFAHSAMDYGYHQQDPYYVDGVTALDLGEDPVFVFVAVEKKPPYLVNVIQLDVVARRIGAHLNRQAIDTYKHCTDTGRWPGYSDEVELASLPGWYERQFENEDI